jgi:hypothetical protein
LPAAASSESIASGASSPVQAQATTPGRRGRVVVAASRVGRGGAGKSREPRRGRRRDVSGTSGIRGGA